MRNVIACVAALALTLGLALIAPGEGMVEAKRKSKSKKELKGKAAMLVDQVGKFAGPRWGAVGAWDAANRSLMNFSGTSHEAASGQMPSFNWANSWQVLDFAEEGKPNADAKWEERKHESEPHYRALASIAQDHENHKVYVFGGFIDMQTLRNDLWEYDLKKKSWTQLDKSIDAAKKPHVRDGAGFCYASDQKSLYLWGGLTSLGNLTCANDLWKFDLKKKIWTDVTPKGGDAPSQRLGGHLQYVGDDKAILMGGFDMTYQKDVWEIDLKKYSYKKKAAAPKAITYSSCVYNPVIKRIVVMGGYDGSKASDHVQLYDPAKDKWEDLGKSGHTATLSMCACNPESGEIYLWGGCVGGFMSAPADESLYRLTIGSEKDIKKLKKQREKEEKAEARKKAKEEK